MVFVMADEALEGAQLESSLGIALPFPFMEVDPEVFAPALVAESSFGMTEPFSLTVELDLRVRFPDLGLDVFTRF